MSRAIAYYASLIPDMTEPAETPCATMRAPDRLTTRDHAILEHMLRQPDEAGLLGSHPEWWRQRN